MQQEIYVSLLQSDVELVDAEQILHNVNIAACDGGKILNVVFENGGKFKIIATFNIPQPY